MNGVRLSSDFKKKLTNSLQIIYVNQICYPLVYKANIVRTCFGMRIILVFKFTCIVSTLYIAGTRGTLWWYWRKTEGYLYQLHELKTIGNTDIVTENLVIKLQVMLGPCLTFPLQVSGYQLKKTKIAGKMISLITPIPLTFEGTTCLLASDT
jgi:hypothetical protein